MLEEVAQQTKDIELEQLRASVQIAISRAKLDELQRIECLVKKRKKELIKNNAN